MGPGIVKVDSLDQLWKKACNGQEHEAYNRLRELWEIEPRGSEWPNRLYGLLLANPELDSHRSPCDWLARGVQAEEPWGPCRHLYRREIEGHPEEALSERYVQLIDTMAATAGVIDVLGWRWDALMRLKRTELIGQDLERVASRLEHKDEQAWVRLLLKAADYVAWQPGRGLGRICREVKRHVHVHAALGEEMARLDYLRELAVAWKRVPETELEAVPLVKSLPLTWINPYENRHPLLLPCRAIAERPDVALKVLNAVFRYERLVVVHLAQTLSWLWQFSADEREASVLRKVVLNCLGDLNHPINEASYLIYQQHLLRMCLTEMVAPETAADFLTPDRDFFVCQRIHNDWPLRTVYLAHRVIWS
jgi:hypothetical protein